jgi:hypothetical protein
MTDPKGCGGLLISFTYFWRGDQQKPVKKREKIFDDRGTQPIHRER